MSVQAGMLRFDKAPIDCHWLERASTCLDQYGPEGEYTYVCHPVAMLYRPFHTTAESRAEQQPLIFGGEKVLTWDGRLDNRDEFIRLLDTSQLAGSSDAAIVAAAVERWGTDCLARIRGDWALALWDPREMTLVLARDYIGARQLFYLQKSDSIIWWNHLSALAQCCGPLHISDEYVAGYLAFKPDAQLTPYREIHSVPPGCFVRVRNAHLAVHAFWSFNPSKRTRHSSDQEYEEHYRHLFRQAVHRRLRSDRPVLSCLSGGLDSSAIVCMADDLLAARETEIRVDTISYYDSSEPDEDDSYHLEIVEQKRGRKGIRICITKPEDCLAFDYSDFTATPGFGMPKEITSTISRLARDSRYRVVLDGTGGDEMNAQALTVAMALADLIAHLNLGEAGKQLLAWSRFSRRPLVQLLLSTALEVLPLSIRARFSWRGELQPWINRRFAKNRDIARKQLEDLPGIWFWRPGRRDSAQTIMTLANELTFSSPGSLETRYPYLDQDLVEFLTSIPFEQLLRPGDRRSLMRRALSALLPPEILRRKTKVSVTRCYSLALQKHWNRVEEALVAPLITDLGYVDRDGLRKDLLRVRNGHCPLHLVRLLKALSLELWLRDVAGRGIVTLPSGASAEMPAYPAQTPGWPNTESVATKVQKERR